jgi:riboflavin kinase/FMN adenylyltransferase
VSARDFVEDILIAQLGAKEIIVGEDFRFGRGASAGNAELRNIAAAHSVRVTVVRKVKAGRRAVSSTLIRQRIASGRFGEASRMLGRPFSVLGTVVSGTRLGRALGYPTANLNPHHEAMPPSGVYAVKVIFGRKTYKGVMNIGVKPTFYDHGRDKEPSIEVHIFDFHRKVYGKDLEVEFVRKLRDERRFKTIDSLVAQIRADAALAKKLLYKTA